jgi:hypothetical protein
LSVLTLNSFIIRRRRALDDFRFGAIIMATI